jgi:hypothetical protein
MSKVVQVNQLPSGTMGLGDSILFSLIAHWIWTATEGPRPSATSIGFAGWASFCDSN